MRRLMRSVLFLLTLIVSMPAALVWLLAIYVQDWRGRRGRR